MFWGVTVDGGKRYSQMVERSFHISMAALEPASAKDPISVMIRHDNSEFLLCSLNSKTILQQYLDLNFTEGEEVSFFLSGAGIVHLTGFLLEEEEEDDDFIPMEESEDEEDSSEEEVPELMSASQIKSKNAKRKLESNLNTSKTKKKKANLFEEDYDYEFDGGTDEDDEFIDKEALEDSEDEESDEQEADSEELSEEEEMTPVLTKKKIKKEQKKTPREQLFPKEQNKTPKEQNKIIKDEKKTPKGEKTPKHKPGSGDHKPASETPSGEKSEDLTESKKKKKKKKRKSKEGGTPENGKPDGTPKEKTTPMKRVVAGGTVIEEKKVGHGPEAKSGKMVHVYYSGKLTSGKQFDSCSSGKPFSFKLGRSEVIKGWDNGVAGMKVGGKRVITVPAQQGYGNQRTGPIPANSTLVFEVELKAVS